MARRSITPRPALWVGAVWATVVFHAPLIFPIFFGAFGLLLLVIVLDQWLGVTRVLAGREGVTVAKGLIVPYRARTLRPSEVAQVTTRIGTQAGRSAYYDITIVTTAGKHVTAGDGIHDKHEAEWLAAAVRSALQGD